MSVKFFVSCAKGTEGPLRRELHEIGVHAPRGEDGGVSFAGPLEHGVRACVWSRVGVRVLMQVGAFGARDARDLYDGARRVDWPAFLSPRTTLAVSAVAAGNQEIRHSGFAALKIKDAVVDAIRDRTGARPNVARDDPDVAIFLHLRGDEARLYLDLSGEPLHRRGYRAAMTDAPLKENLAAAILALGQVAGDVPFLDPMCGGGTLAIEHALRARGVAPGLHRRFGFERWPDPEPARLLAAAVAEARAAAARSTPAAPVVARDRDAAALEAARKNATAAGVARDIAFEHGDLAGYRPPFSGAGTLCTNPPYGERMGADLERIYARLALLLDLLPGFRAVVLSGTPRLERALRRPPRVSHRLWNGPIECRLLCYDPPAAGAATAAAARSGSGTPARPTRWAGTSPSRRPPGGTAPARSRPRSLRR